MSQEEIKNTKTLCSILQDQFDLIDGVAVVVNGVPYFNIKIELKKFPGPDGELQWFNSICVKDEDG